MAISHLKLSVTMVTGTSDQGKGDRVKHAWVTTLCHFCVSVVIDFFSNTTLKFFHYYFEVSTICDEYIRYWNKPGKWKYTSPGQKKPQVPGLGLIVYQDARG